MYASAHPIAKPPAVSYTETKTSKPKHPAAKFFTLTALFLFLAFIFSLIALFVFWTRTTSNGNPTSWYGLWTSCSYANDSVDTNVCENHDQDAAAGSVGANFTAGVKKSADFLLAAQVMAIMIPCMCFVGLIVFALVNKKIWARPLGLSGCLIVWIILTLGVSVASWACWLIAASVGTPGMAGLTYGFIFAVIASFFLLLAMFTACIGTLTSYRSVTWDVPASVAIDPVPVYSPYTTYMY